MKSKAKKKQFRQDVPEGWFYMFHGDMTVGALKEALSDTAYEIEYWEAAQVLEIDLGAGGCMDVEAMEPDFGEASADAFLKEHQVKFLCYITFRTEDYQAARGVMEHICDRIGGFFCGDTDDFTPVINAVKQDL
ncbi:MAG: hypothetical protein HFH81_06415 [Lachnospiraceae bacterium]|jgi:hypothetical protein|nr:hypothetical protein [Lachnospiraceae bacterium]